MRQRSNCPDALCDFSTTFPTMKHYVPLLLLLVLLAGCSKDDDSQPTSKVNKEGLTNDITELVPQVILDEMRRLGMPIYGGETPPALEGNYLGTPFILVSSNRPDDNPGYKFSDYALTLSNQNNEKLRINVDYDNGLETGKGLGGFVVGKDDKFSVFVRVVSTNFVGSTADFVHVISGQRTEDGVADMYFANFMLDNKGNPDGLWIEEGEGRVVYDEDGFSPEY